MNAHPAPRAWAIACGSLLLGGCAVAPPDAPAPIEPPPPVQEATETASGPASLDEVRSLLTEGRDAEAWDALEAVRASDPEEGARLALALGEVLEDAGRPEGAALHYMNAAWSGGEHAASGWDGLARIRRESGDDVGAVRASLRALEAAEAGDRGRSAALRAEIAALEPAERVALGREEWAEGARSLLGGSVRAGGEGTFRVVGLVPFTGKVAAFGDAFRLGAELALEERGVDAPPVALEWKDTRGDLLEAARAARSAIVSDGARAILGPLLSVTSIAAGAVCESYGVPLLAPTATDPELATLGPHVLALQPDPAALARPLGELCVNTLGARRLGVLLATDGTSGEYEREFRDAVEAAGGRVVVSVAFEPGETDFRPQIERLQQENVDAVYIPGAAADLKALASQLDFYDFDRRILGNGAWLHSSILDPDNLSLEGAVFAATASENADSPFRLRFGRQLMERTRDEVSRFHVAGYRAMALLLAALDRGASRGEDIAEILRLRPFWPRPLEAEAVQLLTYRDGVIGPAEWAASFELLPKVATPAPEDAPE